MRRLWLAVLHQGSSLRAEKLHENEDRARARVIVEWMFGDVKIQWTITEFPRKLKLGQAPVGTLYLLAMLLTNFRSCLYGNQTEKYFNVKPPTLEEYINHK